jgi:8-oxo-dGTP pyrophosphatase MutT (NUDIX family)
MLNEQGEGGSRECLVISSSRDSCKWVFPKGGWENDESLEEAARRETLEEAGVKRGCAAVAFGGDMCLLVHT